MFAKFTKDEKCREHGAVVVERQTLESKGPGFDPHRHHCCVLEQDTLTLYSTG